MDHTGLTDLCAHPHRLNRPNQTEQSRFLKWLLKFEVKIVFNGNS
jgi:hypothetical protein